jgi:hypothetical protein
MRFSLLAMFGVMTAVALLLGLPDYVYGVIVLVLLWQVLLALVVLIVQAPLDSAIDFLQLFASRRRLEDYDNPPFGIDVPAKAKPQADESQIKTVGADSQ